MGYGDRTPNTDSEKTFAILTEMAGGMVFGMLAGTPSYYDTVCLVNIIILQGTHITLSHDAIFDNTHTTFDHVIIHLTL